jgi:hypothetical protein
LGVVSCLIVGEYVVAGLGDLCRRLDVSTDSTGAVDNIFDDDATLSFIELGRPESVKPIGRLAGVVCGVLSSVVVAGTLESKSAGSEV